MSARDNNVVPFPGRDEPPILDAEVVASDERIRVDQPEQKGPAPWAAGEPERRPVLAPWLVDKQQRTQAEKWALGFAKHWALFHLARIPIYLSRVTTYTPRGAGRIVWALLQWAADTENAPLRAAAVRHENVAEYARIDRVHAQHVRGRRLVLILLTVAAAGGAVALEMFAPLWAQALAITAAVAVCTRAGRPAGKPFLDVAVVAPQAQRLTSDVVTRALGSLGIGEINKLLVKDPNGITFPSPIQRDGPGWRADVDLPYGVTASDIMYRRNGLASGLRRPLGCVWPEPAHDQHAGRLVLWVGDQDMSQVRPPAWPLAKKGQVDLFGEFPFGTDKRGRVVQLCVAESNLLIGSLPGAGKTGSLKVVLLAASLDPTAELRIFELKGSGDLQSLEKIAHHYGCGPDDGTIEAAVASLREVHADLERRARAIRDLPKDLVPDSKVTRGLANRRALRLHPVVIAIDEIQELFTHPDFKDEAERLCTAIIKRGRALGVILLMATQRPDAQSLPKQISTNAGLRFCLRVMDQPANDMVLPTSSYKKGFNATLFTKKDRGIGWLVGASDDPEIVRSYYVDGPAAEKVTTRARAVRESQGLLSGHCIGEVQESAPSFSLLDDVYVVFAKHDRMWSEDIRAGLAELRPGVYGGWSVDALAQALKPLGVPTKQINMTVGRERRNQRGVHRSQLMAALDARRVRRAEEQ